jgi:hypothetical protein
VTTLNTQLGVVDEVSYGTGLTVTRFYELISESIEDVIERIDSKGLRRSTRVQRSDRFTPVNKGAAGNIELEVATKGFGWWLKHLLGTVAIDGSAGANGEYSHVGTVGSLLGDSFTLQVNRPLHPAGTDQAFTYAGGKVPKWELANDVDGYLIASIDCDFQSATTATALATASYPSGAELLSWVGGELLIDDVAVEVTNVKIGVDSGLKVDRHYLRGSAAKREPVEAALRDITFEFECDFASLAQRNRVASATAAGALGELTATWEGPTALGGSTYPALEVLIPVARFDVAKANVDGPDPLMESVSGRGLFDGTNSPITLTYTTADATP